MAFYGINLFVCICSLAILEVIAVDVGTLPNLQHEIGGTFEILSVTRIRLRGFSYDGQGPAAYLYYYPPGVPVDSNRNTAQGIKIVLPPPAGGSDGRLVAGRRYSNEDLTFDLPNGADVCDIASFTVWCEGFSVFFSRLDIPRSTFGNDGADPCTVVGLQSPTTPGPTTPPPPTVPRLTSVMVGTLPNLQHGLGGTFEILSPTRIKLRDFSYDGLGPAAFLYYYGPGVPVDPIRSTARGVKIPLPSGGSGGRLNRRYSNEDLTFDLPSGTDMCDIATFTVWCEAASAFFTRIEIPRSTFVDNGADPCTVVRLQSQTTPGPTTPPPPTVPRLTSVVVGTLPNLQHGLGGTFEILSPTRINLRDFSYDGFGPAAFLYYYGPGVPVDPVRSTARGVKIPLPSGGSGGRLNRRYSNENLTFDLPSGTDVCDMATFTVWCEAASAFFTRIEIPRSTFVDNGADPCTIPGLPTLPPVMSTTSAPPTTARVPPAPGGHANCKPLHSSLQLSWTVHQDTQRISFMLCGCQSSNPTSLQYMAFGLSGNTARTSMDGADVTIAWIDNSMGPRAQDYHLQRNNRVQCRGGMGVCPDVLDHRGTCRDDIVSGSIRGFSMNRQQCVSFTRMFRTSDSDCDLTFDPANEQFVVWAIGGIEETAFRHFDRSGSDSAPLHLGRDPQNQCHNVPITCSSCGSFASQRILAANDYFFSARIGPSGSDRGYMGITGQSGWGIAWYINGILVPEIIVERGRKYTFIIEGGDDSSDSANYHPFYITNSSSGGRLLNTQEQRQSEVVYAGLDVDGRPNAIGRLCMSTETTNSTRVRERCGSLEEYQNSLRFQCSPNSQPGRLEWTPDRNTPNVVYYQCATHRNLGWRISVKDIAGHTGFAVNLVPFPLLSYLLLLGTALL